MSIGTISGDGFKEGAFTLEGYIKGLKNIGDYTQEDLYISYIRAKQKISYLSECAKIYILENWEKVDDWSELNIIIADRDGNETEFYNYEESNINYGEGASDIVRETFKRVDEWRKEKHNPVESFGEPVLDTVDGDFSVTINGQDFLWLSEDEIMQIAGYIEYRLREQDG